MTESLAGFNGIYIVSKKDKNNKTELTKLFDLVSNKEVPTKIKINNLPSGIKGPDGKPVDTSLGALLSVTHIPDTRAKSGYGIHFANVAASVPESQLQYEYALWKLGLGIKPKGNISKEVLEEQFRQQISKKGSESN